VEPFRIRIISTCSAETAVDRPLKAACRDFLASPLLRQKILIIIFAVGFLGISGCGYRRAAAYVTQPTVSFWGLAERTQSDPIKARIAQFAGRYGFRMTTTVYAQLDPRGSEFSAYLEKRSVLGMMSANNCVVQVAFYRARIFGVSRQELSAMTKDIASLMSEVDVKLIGRPMTLEDQFPPCKDLQ
jgi:hypothetical protein